MWHVVWLGDRAIDPILMHRFFHITPPIRKRKGGLDSSSVAIMRPTEPGLEEATPLRRRCRMLFMFFACFSSVRSFVLFIFIFFLGHARAPVRPNLNLNPKSHTLSSRTRSIARRVLPRRAYMRINPLTFSRSVRAMEDAFHSPVPSSLENDRIYWVYRSPWSLQATRMRSLPCFRVTRRISIRSRKREAKVSKDFW